MMKNCDEPLVPIAGPNALAKRPKSERYEPPPINLEDRNNSQTLAIEMIGKNKQVLEVGTSTGYVTKVIQNLGNRVTGIEIDKDAGDAAKQFCESMIIGDVEELELDAYFEPSSFDIVLLGDILEHLHWPGRLLVRLRKYLKPGAYLVVSLPNVCHGDLLLNLLDRDFRYTSMGLLDETHLRFFGRRNISRFFAANGYAIEELHRVHVPVGGTEQRTDPSKIPAELLKLIKALPDSDVFQFVFKAVPSDCPSVEAVQETDLHALFEAAVEDIRKKHEEAIALSSRNLVQADTKVAELEHETSRLQQTLSDQEGKLLNETNRALNLEQSVLVRDTQIASLSNQLQHANARTLSLEHYTSQLRQTLSDQEGKLLNETNRALNLEQSVLVRDTQIASLSNQLQQANARALSLEDKIVEMQRSIVWQLVMRYHNCFVEQAFPQGTIRRRWYDHGLERGRQLANKDKGAR